MSIKIRIIIWLLFSLVHWIVFVSLIYLIELSIAGKISFGSTSFYHGLITRMNVPLRWVASDFLRANPQFYWLLLTLNSLAWGGVGLVFTFLYKKIFRRSQ
jgi:hypothetical protein